MVQPRRTTGSYGNSRSMLTDVLVTALIGAGIVALWFLALDVLRGRLFFTPAALGSAMLLGARGEDQVEINALTVLGYSVLHAGAFLAIAWMAVRLFRAREEEPRAVLGAALLFITMEVFVIGVVAILAGWLLDALSLWGLAVATLIAAAAMGLYLLRKYPGVHDELRVDLESRQ